MISVPGRIRRRASRPLLAALAGLSAAIWPVAAAQDAAAEGAKPPSATAALPHILHAEGSLAAPLEATDADRYRQIFRLQRDGAWRGADRLIGRLTDLRLLGHVLGQRYLHPTAYRSSYRELHDWLARYGDHPEALRIHRLAMKRKPADAAGPAAPTFVDPLAARGAGRSFTGEERGPAWEAGLEAWRQGRIAESARQFERLANTASSPWNIAAGAFWAARSHRAAGSDGEADRWLRRAAAYPESFYGMLARRSLAQTLRQTGQPLAESGAAQRAAALLQIGETKRAVGELGGLFGRTGTIVAADFAAAPGLAALAEQAVADIRRRQLDAIDPDEYPVPRWRPRGGFRLDPALLYAVMRHESGFDPRAIGAGGASGLMQLMPATAAVVAKDLPGFKATGAALLDPEINLTLGQRYIERLLAHDAVGGDLLRAAVAYNVGTGALARWRAATATDDPLLFLASLPLRRTRILVERVFASMWIYQFMLGAESPSLDALAAGDWPAYVAPKNLSGKAAEYVSD